ncbi:MAG: VOC family protein [Nocardioides sp.]|jgi:predicted enzyme related to lactoylglutathione lyase
MAKFESYKQGVPNWIEHSSADPAASKEFYGRLFGWEYDDQPMGETPAEGVYSLAGIDGDTVAGLGPVMGDAPPSWGVYLAADDVDAAVERATQAGAVVLAGPFDVFDAGRMAWVADPQGAVVGLWQARNHIGSQRANEPGTNIWNELVTTDIEAATQFYQATVGLDADTQDWPGMGSYTTWQVDGESVGGACPPFVEGMPPHWNVYFNVEDADATSAQAQGLGAQVVQAPFDVPGVGRMAVLQDPQGAYFNLMQNPAEG